MIRQLLPNKGISGNPSKAQQQYSSKFDKDSMDHQPHPVQKHFINQQSPGGYQQAQASGGLDDLNEFQLEQYYEQMQALQNQEQVGKFNQQKQLLQINSNSGVPVSNGVTQQQIQEFQQQQQQIFKQQHLSQQIQQSQAQQLNYDKKYNQIQSPQYSQDDLQDDHNAEGINDENIYDDQQMAQLTNHLNGNLNVQGNSQFNNLSQGSNQNQNSNTNNSFSSAEEVIKSTDDTTIKEEFKEIDKQWQKQLNQDPEKYFEKIIEMNDIASQKLNDGQQREALAILYKAEKMLELAASCGKVIDRNLIIVVLYNRACAYQSLWILDKCSKYIDGVIYNLEMSLKEEDSIESMSDLAPNLTESMKQGGNYTKTGRKKTFDKDLLAYKIKKQTFLVKSYLQCCAILSQQGLHQKALDTANEGATVLKRIFTQCFEFCKEIIKENEIHQTCNTMIKSPRQMFQNGLSQGPLQSKSNCSAPPTQRNNSSSMKNQPYHFQSNQNNYFSKENVGQQNLTSDYSMDSMMSSRKSVQQAKEEVYFQKLVVEFAHTILKDIQGMINIEDSDKTQVDHFRDAKRSLYFWKNNPENNERHIRQELNVPTKLNEEETRSILGVQNGSEWIESFNIGSIMHMVPVQYEEFSFFGDLMYEISKKMILEKVIYLSISYFTIATEIRFIEIERNKHLNPKSDQTKNIDTEGFKKSQIYHLKSIEIVCQHITCKSPYINHLITSYHKHYNQNLETILEESFSSFQDNNIFDGSQNQQNNFINNQNHQQYNILQQEDQGQQFEELVNNFVNGMSEDDQTPVYIQNNPHLSTNNAHNINNSSLNNLQNNSMTKFNSINGQIIQSDDIIMSNEKRIPSPNQRNGSNSNLKKQINGQPKQVNAGSQGIKSSYSGITKSTENGINNKEKKIGSHKQVVQANQVLTSSALNKKNLNLDFNGNHLTSSTTNMHSTNVNQQNMNPVNRNLAEFFSHENSKKNTPRGILNIRKSTPAVEQSSKEVALTEPNIPSSTSQPRSNSKVTKKSKQNNLQNSQIKKMNALTIEKVTQILKNNLLASYSSAFLSCSNVATLNHSKNPSSNQDRKKPQTAAAATTSAKQTLNSSPGLKKKSTSNIYSDPLRKSACIGQQQTSSGLRTNNSSIKNNLNNNSSSVPSTTQSSTKSKKQATSTTSRQQTTTSANFQAQLQSNTNQQQYCNTDRQIKDSEIQQQKVVLSEARESTERNKIVKIKNEGKQKVVTTVPFSEDISEKKKLGQKQSTSQSKNSKEQKNIENKKFLSPSLTASNFLSLKTMKKETIQQLLKDSSKIIPKLNLSQLKLKTDDIRFFSPRETTTNSNLKKQQI